MAQSLETLIARCLALTGRSNEAPQAPAGAAAGQVNSASPLDANPYWLLRAGRRQEAVRLWETALKANPTDLRIWRELAVAYYWQARDQENRGEKAIAHWEKAIGYWTGILASDDYWRAWAEERATPCGLLPEDREPVRYGFLTVIESASVREPERVESYLDAVSSVRQWVRDKLHLHLLSQSRVKNSEEAKAYKDLLIQLDHEWAVAYRLDRLKMVKQIVNRVNQQGLPQNLAGWLSGMDWESEPDIQIVLNTVYTNLDLCNSSRNEFPSCGPGMLQFLEMATVAEDFVAECQTLNTAITGVTPLLQNVLQDSSRLKFYLNMELGRLLAMINLGEYEQCKSELMGQIDKRPGGSMEKQLQQLMCLCCHNQSEAARASCDYETAIADVELAERYCGPVYDDTDPKRPFKCDIPKLITRICDSIAEAVSLGDLPQPSACNFLGRLAQVAPRGRVPYLFSVRERLCE